jgi:hypothetical protein
MSTTSNDKRSYNLIDCLENNEKVGRPIVFALLVVCLGFAAFSMQNINYEEYCKEPQAKCHLNKNTSVSETFSNIFNTLRNGPK